MKDFTFFHYDSCRPCSILQSTLLKGAKMKKNGKQIIVSAYLDWYEHYTNTIEMMIARMDEGY